ncbi:MAG: IS605 OrfB-like transposable element containing RNAse H-like and Zn finger domain [Candidatus Methanohalarchaeum thermophilum]|uniref:IS605 OrfB-like transposable element containing RNAse H-like and Zn finger domain n=1 Tax=Methanohalarchaeum thermophilum TaxID=1903181 RepID=A0A1Q6DSI6_METT1|nr:MAG: IS605 OrfB-like transposable element containing RNAse H-like and Zn finger domain [Candidatus Methanohalarchaeum thermophilum]
MEDKDIKQIEIFRDEVKEEYYVLISYGVDIPRYKDNGEYQAFDLGVDKHMGVDMGGKFVGFRNPRPGKFWQLKMEEV